MPIASPEVYAEMLDRAKAGSREIRSGEGIPIEDF